MKQRIKPAMTRKSSQARVALISAPRTQRQMDLCEFWASLVYIASSRTGKAAQRNPVCWIGWGSKRKII